MPLRALRLTDLKLTVTELSDFQFIEMTSGSKSLIGLIAIAY